MLLELSVLSQIQYFIIARRKLDSLLSETEAFAEKLQLMVLLQYLDKRVLILLALASLVYSPLLLQKSIL